MPTREIGGHKVRILLGTDGSVDASLTDAHVQAALKNPHVSEEAKEHSRQMIDELSAQGEPTAETLDTELDELADGFRVRKAVLEVLQLRLLLALPAVLLDGLDILTLRDRKNVEFVIEY